jgi:hypothetical protein
VKTPVLMENGRYDDIFPLESSQRRLFHLLGTPDKDKKHVIFEAGHGGWPPAEDIRECLDWLDKYLGRSDETRLGETELSATGSDSTSRDYAHPSRFMIDRDMSSRAMVIR